MKLSDHVTLEGKKANLSYKDEVNTYSVVTYGKKDKGIVVCILFTSKETEAPRDKQMVDLFVKSIAITNNY